MSTKKPAMVIPKRTGMAIRMRRRKYAPTSRQSAQSRMVPVGAMCAVSVYWDASVQV
jgi:hypothetical protein